LKKAKISLDSVEKVKEFVNVASRLDCDLDLKLGRKVIDGKSIMGIFSLDLTKPIVMHINARSDTEYILKALEEFIIPL
jgi:phosphotransferase system HPr-like phosphotransfer protein